MAQTVYFNGEILTIPGAYSTIDTSAMATKGNAADAKVIALLGECDGGEPGAVQFFTEPTAARRALKSGILLKACEKAWNPVSKTKEGVKLGGANMIACIRTNQATKSELKIFPKSGGVKPQLVFESKDWGENTAHQIKIQDGSLNNTKKLTVYDQLNGTYETFDNIGNAFTINYTGSEAYAELNIYLDGSNAMYLQTKVGENEETAQEDIAIRLDNTKFRSMKYLITELQSYENYVVSATNQYNMRLKVTDLDIVKKANIKLGEESHAFRVTGVFADMESVLRLNSQLVQLVEFDKTLGDVTNFDYTYLTGGTNGTSPSSWVKYFDALSNFDIFYIVPLVSDVSIHAELAAHIEEMSGNLGRERRGVVGGENTETVIESIQRARNLSTSRMQVVHGGFYDINSYNELELYPPYILAAQHAGRAAFLEDGEPATHDVYRMSAPEYKLERNEITQLLQGGVLAFEFVLGKNGSAQSYVRLVQDLTTDTSSTDTVHTERATGALADSINKEIREALDGMLTGKRVAKADLTSAKNRVVSILQDRQRRGHVVAFKDVYVTKSGTVTEVDYSVAPAEPNNFTLITAHYYSEKISV